MIETTDAGVTVSAVEPLVPPRVAVIGAVPVAREVPSALELKVTIAGFPDIHVLAVVRSCVLPSLNAPIAVNCCVVPNAMEVEGGFTVIDRSAALVTVRVEEDKIKPDDADTLHVPLETLVAIP